MIYTNFMEKNYNVAHLSYRSCNRNCSASCTKNSSHPNLQNKNCLSGKSIDFVTVAEYWVFIHCDQLAEIACIAA